MAKAFKKNITPARSIKHKKIPKGKALSMAERMKEPPGAASRTKKGFGYF